ncbi:hypothetical protein B0H10DRAFT_2211739 [Mycena sp. CBHHK59/15]|nr:hypothetical protein B0H10DRAFT_2211739 [Mycena sp. CBHHK59/15]
MVAVEAVAAAMAGAIVRRESLATLTQDIMITRYVNVATFVILLYDHLLSLGAEVKLIWPAKLTSAKALFLFIRYMVPCAMLIYNVRQLIWDKQFTMCTFRGPVPVAILWAPGTVFECVLCVISWWNALNRQRTSNAPLTAALYRDGFVYFLFLLALRITNTALAFAAPPGLTFIAMFPVWCATTTTTCRLIIKLRQITEDQTPEYSGDRDESVVVHGDYDELGRSGVHVEMLRSVGPSTPVRGGWS